MRQTGIEPVPQPFCGQQKDQGILIPAALARSNCTTQLLARISVCVEHSVFHAKKIPTHFAHRDFRAFKNQFFRLRRQNCFLKWARPDSNRRSSPCKGDIIATRPRAQIASYLLSFAGFWSPGLFIKFVVNFIVTGQ